MVFLRATKDLHRMRKKRLRDVKLTDAEQWMTALRAEFSNNTVRHYVVALSGLFERAVKYELIARNPASAKDAR